MNVTFAHSGLPTAIRPFDLIDLLWRVRGLLGLQDVHIAYLRHLFLSVRSEDFQRGRICAAWTSPGKLADELQVSPRQLNRVEARLEEVGLILRSWGANRRRFGYRDQDGRIVAAGGINLGPIIERVDELFDLLRIKESEEQNLRLGRKRANVLIKAIRGLDDEVALAAARAILPRLRPAEIRQSDRLNEVIEALSAILADFTTPPSQTSGPSQSDNTDRPNTTEKTKIKKCIPPAATRPPVKTSPIQIVALATERFREIITLYQKGLAADTSRGPGWDSICMAARELSLSHGVSGLGWCKICNTLGQARAALAITIIDRNSQREGRWKVENVAGALLGMVKAETAGRATLDSLAGEALRALERKKVPNGLA